MAKHAKHSDALEMRKKGMSYSEIKDALGVSKSTLSLWLRAHPLSKSRIDELRGNSPRRIERFRATMQGKRLARLKSVYALSSKKIGKLSKREIFLAGIFLYWAEGTKGARDVFMATNTDPAMLRFFLVWLDVAGIPRSKVVVKLHVYKDMDIQKENVFWSKTLAIPLSAFRKPYIKDSSWEKRKNYKGRTGHGTCNLIVYSRDLYEVVMTGILHLRIKYGDVDLTAIQDI